MDITCTATGETFFRIDSAVGALLLSAFPEAFKRYKPEPTKPAPSVPLWQVGRGRDSGEPSIFLRFGAETYAFLGDPSRAAAYFRRQKPDTDLPADTLAEYTRLKNAE